MTPTEQDKELRDKIEAVFKNPHCESCHEDWDYDSSYKTDSCCTRFMTDSISKVVELITADRKRVALEIIDRIEKVYYTPSKESGYLGLDHILEHARRELKAQQEEV